MDFTKRRWTERIMQQGQLLRSVMKDGERLSPFGILCEMAQEEFSMNANGAYHCRGRFKIPDEQVLTRMGITYQQAQRLAVFLMYEAKDASDVCEWIGNNL